MEIKLKKDLEKIKREVMLKSVDLDDDIEDFEIDIDDYEYNNKFITISPNCVRCDLCVKECPINAISPSNLVKSSKINDNCVKCEICAQTCPVSCIYVMETKSKIDTENNNVEYDLKKLKVPHRQLKMEDIKIDRDKCKSCGTCVKFCPTKAITLKEKSLIEAVDDKEYPNLKEDNQYPYIKKSLCVGCGSCANLCPNEAIDLKKTLGTIIETKKLNIDQDACVECNLCEESCPVEAIKLKDGKVILDNEKCIKCDVCSMKCPVNALTLKNMKDIE